MCVYICVYVSSYGQRPDRPEGVLWVLQGAHMITVHDVCVRVCVFVWFNDKIVVKEFFGCYKVHILLVYMTCVHVCVFLWSLDATRCTYY